MSPRSLLLPRFLRPTALILGLAPTLSASAADRLWNNITTDFNAGTNWTTVGAASTNTAPTAGDTAFFLSPTIQLPILGGPASLTNVNFFGTGVTFSSTGPSSTLSLSATGSVLTSYPLSDIGTTTITGPIVLTRSGGAASTVDLPILGGNMVISGNISSTNANVGITKAGFGTLTLSGDNSGLSGTISLNGGNGNFGLSRTNLNSNTALGSGTTSVGQGNGGTTLGNTSGSTVTLSNPFNLSATSGGTTHWDLPNNDITLNGAVTLNGASAQTATVDVVGGTLSFRAGVGQNVTGHSLNKMGSGTLVLAGNMSYTGTTSLNGGTLVLDKSDPTTVLTSAPNTLSNSTFVLKGSNSASSSYTLPNMNFNGRSGLTVDANGGTGPNSTTLTVGNTWTRGNGVGLQITLSNNAFLSSSPTVTNGVVVSGAGNAYVTVADPNGIGFATVSGGNVVRYTGASVFAASGNSGTVNYVTKVGDPGYSGSSLTLGSNQTVNTLQIDTSAGAGSLELGSTTFSMTSRGMLVTGNNDFTVNGGQLGASGVEFNVHQFGTGVLTLNSKISSAGAAFVKNGPGSVVIANPANVATGLLYVNEGTVRITGKWAGGATVGGSTLNTRGTLSLESAGAISAGTITVGGPSTLNQTVANAISGSAAVSVNGAPGSSGNFNGETRANLSMANNYTGQTTLSNNAILNIGHPQAIGTGALTISTGGGIIDNTSGVDMTLANNNPITLNGSLQFTGTRSLNMGMGAVGLGTGLRTVIVHNNTLTIGGVISGSSTAAAISKTGPGTLVLANANTYEEATELRQGLLRLDHVDAIPLGTDALGGLDMFGGILGLNAGDFTRPLGSGNDAVNINGSTGFAAFGTDRVVNIGGASLTLTWGSTFFLPTTSQVLMFGHRDADATLNFQNPIILGAAAATRIIHVDNGSAAVDAKMSGALTGSGPSLVKSGAGTLELTATSTFTGSTSIAGGKLLVSGSGSLNSSSGIAVSSGATLAYSSSVNLTAPISFKSGGKLGGTNWRGSLGGLTVGSAAGQLPVVTPGNSPGTASTTSQTWANGGIYEFEINNVTGTAGTNWDLISGTGNLTLDGTLASGTFTIDLISLNGSNGQAALAGFDPDSNYSWNIATFAGLNGQTFSSGMFTIDTTAFDVFNTYDGSFGVSNSGGTITLEYTAIPEPSVGVLMVVGIFGWLGRRGRIRSKVA